MSNMSNRIISKHENPSFSELRQQFREEARQNLRRRENLTEDVVPVVVTDKDGNDHIVQHKTGLMRGQRAWNGGVQVDAAEVESLQSALEAPITDDLAGCTFTGTDIPEAEGTQLGKDAAALDKAAGVRHVDVADRDPDDFHNKVAINDLSDEDEIHAALDALRDATEGKDTQSR